MIKEHCTCELDGRDVLPNSKQWLTLMMSLDFSIVSAESDVILTAHENTPTVPVLYVVTM